MVNEKSSQALRSSSKHCIKMVQAPLGNRLARDRQNHLVPRQALMRYREKSSLQSLKRELAEGDAVKLFIENYCGKESPCHRRVYREHLIDAD